MPVSSPTRTSTRRPSSPDSRRLSEVARHVVIPEGIVTTGWPAVEAKWREWDPSRRFDGWQRGLGRVILGKRADGLYAATEGGVTLSIPRQVAKTFLIGRIVFALCVLFPGLKVLWTAHRTRTSDETFRKLSALARTKALRPLMAPTRTGGVRSGNGQQEIEFRNGSRILFGAREQGFGRGFDEVDVIVFDEAQILTVRALEDMVAATNQARNPHGALLFYMGTPPRPDDPGEVFAERRREALTLKSGKPDFGEPTAAGDAVYVECSADANIGKLGGPALDNHDEWRKANPSFPLRTPLASMKRLRKNLTSDDAWRREALGVWDDDNAASVISRDDWMTRLGNPPKDGRTTFAVKFSLDGSRLVLSAARRPGAHITPDTPVFVEVVERAPTIRGTKWLVDWLAERWQRTACIVLDGKAGVDALYLALREAGVPERVIRAPGHGLTPSDAVAAYAGLVEAVRAETVSHAGQQGLVDSIATSGKRDIGNQGGWGFKPITADGDETPTESVALALHGAMTSKRVPGQTQKAVVM